MTDLNPLSIEPISKDPLDIDNEQCVVVLSDRLTMLEQKVQVLQIIENIYSKYANNPYMLSKTHSYVCNQLPHILDNLHHAHDMRVIRMEELTNDQDAFIQSFLNNNQYFYITSTEKFFYYDGVHYFSINEDDILYHVLSSITRDGNLMSWKQRTKINIMKRIKDNSLLKTIPESETIQYVIDTLCPSIFSTRNEAKYFLTILGDNILRKNTNLIHYVNSKSKNFIRELNNASQMLVGIGLSATFKHKYHDHLYADCRLLKMNDCVKIENIWSPIVKQSTIDIICVACHYSTRYNSSDDFILNASNDKQLINSTFYLKDIQHVDIVNMFMNEYLDMNIDRTGVAGAATRPSVIILDGQINTLRTPQITWKNMQYLWKHFLDSKHLPSVMYQHTFKTILMDKMKKYYNEGLDSFIGICSKYLPDIQKFLQFWGETIIIDETEMDFEIEEIVVLFRKWSELNGEVVTNLNDKQILDLIVYFFPNIEIERDKYISRIRCTLWDKQMDIQVALENMKDTIRNKYSRQTPSTIVSGNLQINPIMNIENVVVPPRPFSPSANCNISIYDAYIFYCKLYSTQHLHQKQIVSKSYFEKYVFDNLSEYIVESKFLSMEWYMF